MAKDTAAAKETAKEPEKVKPQHVYRTDLGEALPTPPLKTATDKE